MKKSLVALAVLAASGASFAQANLTGELAYGFLDTNSGLGVKASGLGIDTSNFNLGVSEDLGGGTSISGSWTVSGGNGQAGAVSNDGQTLALKTPYASFKLASTKPGNWLQGATGYGVWYGLDGRVLGARSPRDSASVSVPVTSAITLSATYYEPANLIGEGTGIAGTSAQQNMTYNVAYAAGALSAQLGYVDYTNEGATDATLKSAARLGGSYDLGVAKLGLGVSYTTHSDSGKVTEALLSASVPLGALSLNAGFASSKLDADTTSTLFPVVGTRTGYMLGAQYNVSKRTYAILNYGSWEGAIGDTQRANLTALTLVHDF